MSLSPPKHSAPPIQALTLVTQVYYPDQQATSQLLSALATALATESRSDLAGLHPNTLMVEVEAQRRQSTSESSLPEDSSQTPWRVRVLCGYPSRARGETQSTIPKFEDYQGVEIARGGVKIDGKRSLIHRAIAYFAFLAWLAFQLLFKTPTHHRVLVVTNPPFAPLIVWGCSQLRRVWGSSYTYLILLHDLSPDGLIALQKLSPRAWWVKIWMALNRAALSRAQRVITLGRDMSRHCHETYRVPHELMTTVTNWSPVEWSKDQYREPQETELFQKLPDRARQDDVMLVQYSGNMGLWHNIDDLVRTAALVHDAPIHFVMIGEGRRKAAAQALAAQLNLSNITWLPFQPLDALTDSLQCAHVSLVSQRSEVLGVMVPSKLYGILASGRAVIAQAPITSEVALTLTEHNCGLVLESSEPEFLAHLLQKLSSNMTDVLHMGLAARDAYRNHHSCARAVQRFREILHESHTS